MNTHTEGNILNRGGEVLRLKAKNSLTCLRGHGYDKRLAGKRTVA